MPDSLDILKSVFGFDGFRPGQTEIVEAILRGEEVLAIMPTGGGKSLCYQLPALMRNGLTVVVSPLIALMRDQVRSLQEVGIEAHALTSANTEREQDAAFSALGEGRCKLLYIAPERLARSETIPMLRRAGAAHIAVDEAHCVSQWGHDFRPDYLRIGALRRALGVSMSAFTATADQETRTEIIEKIFGDDAPQIFLHGFDRPNLALAFAVKDRPRAQILNFAAARKKLAGIVYCGTRAKTETLAHALTEAGHSAVAYHGGMEPETRRQVEERFQREDGLIVCATVAFGMGVDKPDIRWVAHADLPKSVEAYYQEIGRAGRDGAPADTLTLFGADDIRFRRTQIDESFAPPDRRMADHGRLNALLGLAEALSCRRQALLGYFGESSKPCGNCDTCDTPPDIFDGTEVVRMALSAVLRSEERFGAGHLIDLLTGRDTEKIRQWGHDQLPTFGVGKSYSPRVWQAIFRQMMGHDLLRPDPSRHGALRMTENARPILRGEASIQLRKDVLSVKSSGPVAKALVSDAAAPLLSALKAKRRALAEAARVPAYVIFNDRTLIEMAETQPQTLDDLARVGGVGVKKLERYGAEFLTVIAGASETLHPIRRKLAGSDAGALFDALREAEQSLARGVSGIEKPMSCSAAELRRLAEQRPRTLDGVIRLIGDRHADRFGTAFLQILQDA